MPDETREHAEILSTADMVDTDVKWAAAAVDHGGPGLSSSPSDSPLFSPKLLNHGMAPSALPATALMPRASGAACRAGAETVGPAARCAVADPARGGREFETSATDFPARVSGRI